MAAKLHWGRAIGLGIVLVSTTIALAAVLFLVASWQWEWKHITVGVVSCVLMGSSVSVYFHRYLTHSSYEFPWWALGVQYILAVSANAAQQASGAFWEAAHSKHHAHSDKRGDPHSPLHGFWHAWGLWVMYEPSPSWERFVQLPQVNAVARWTSGRFTSLLSGPVLALAACYAIAGWQGMVWYLAAVGLVWHITASVNTFCHLHPWGYRNPGPETHDRSTNLSFPVWWKVFGWLMMWLSFGEWLHSNHHQHLKSAKFSRRWWEIDLGYREIWMFWTLGLVKNVKVF